MKWLLVAGMVGISSAVSAASFTESDDAGDAPGTAQILGTLADGDTISGTISAPSTNSDADLFGFSWSGGEFRASTIGGAAFDTQLHLFNSDGTGIGENDDPVVGGLQAAFAFLLAPGDYFLGISSFNIDATGVGGDIFDFGIQSQDLDGNLIQGVIDPARVVTGFASGTNGGSGSYTIAISQTAVVPLPATLPLAIAGLGVLLGAAHSRRPRV